MLGEYTNKKMAATSPCQLQNNTMIETRCYPSSVLCIRLWAGLTSCSYQTAAAVTSDWHHRHSRLKNTEAHTTHANLATKALDCPLSAEEVLLLKVCSDYFSQMRVPLY